LPVVHVGAQFCDGHFKSPFHFGKLCTGHAGRIN
jgi:hypothetical protein